MSRKLPGRLFENDDGELECLDLMCSGKDLCEHIFDRMNREADIFGLDPPRRIVVPIFLDPPLKEQVELFSVGDEYIGGPWEVLLKDTDRGKVRIGYLHPGEGRRQLRDLVLPSLAALLDRPLAVCAHSGEEDHFRAVTTRGQKEAIADAVHRHRDGVCLKCYERDWAIPSV